MTPRSQINSLDTIRTNRIRIIFIASAVLLLLLSVLSYYRINSLHKTSELITHTTQVKLDLENIYLSVSEADSRMRGFVLTKDSTYIQRFDQSQMILATCMDSLEQHVSDNYSQRTNVIRLKDIVKKRMDYMHYLLKQSGKRKIETPQWLEARRIMSDLRNLLNHMSTEEDMLLKLRRAALNEELLVTPLFTVFLTVAALLVLIASYLMVNRELNTSNSLRSDLILSQQQLQQQNAMLEERNATLDKMNKELESFTYISSHDLQEPLRKMQTFISRIMEKDKTNLSDTGQTYLERTQYAANRLQNLIQDLLAYSRVNKESFPSKNEDLYLLINEVRDDLNEEIQAARAIIEVKGKKQVRIIASQFRQLLINLVSNAIKFSAQGSPPHIVISHSEVVESDIPNGKNCDRKFSKIAVSDNGIGFDAAYKERIFEVFQRLHTREEYTGTGIGLAIVKKIVENHGGYVTAEGETGKGATFTIYIPAAQD